MPKQCLQEQLDCMGRGKFSKTTEKLSLAPFSPEGIHISSNQGAHLFWRLSQNCSYSLSLLPFHLPTQLSLTPIKVAIGFTLRTVCTPENILMLNHSFIQPKFCL